MLLESQSAADVMGFKSARTVVAVFTVCLVAAVPAQGHAHPRHKPYEPFYGTVGGEGWPVYHGWFAVPACIVNAESHGLVHEHSHPWGSSGLYQIEPATWAAEGGLRFARLPYMASKRVQSLVAARIWDHGRGASNWSTAYGCGW